MTVALSEFRTACIIAEVSQSKLAQLQKRFERVIYRPDEKVTDEELKEVDIWFTTWTGLPSNVERLEQIPRTKAVQLSSGELSTCATGLTRASRSKQVALPGCDAE